LVDIPHVPNPEKYPASVVAKGSIVSLSNTQVGLVLLGLPECLI